MRTQGVTAYAGLRLLAAGVLLTVFGSASALDEDYLQAVEAETSKVERQALDPEAPIDRDDEHHAEPMDGGSVNSSPNSTNPDIARERFESDLDRRYHGSFVFYSKLPERSRQEIFEEYQQGATIREIRKKIIDRYLQR